MLYGRFVRTFLGAIGLLLGLGRCAWGCCWAWVDVHVRGLRLKGLLYCCVFF